MKRYCKTPTVYQMEAAECGAAALSMICAYFEKHISLEQMRIETGISRNGCNAGNLMRAGKKFGFEVHGYRKKTRDLQNIQLPCIIHWNYNHFVVFEGFKGKYAFLNDPEFGRRRLTFEELDAGFTGIVLTFKPAINFQKEKKPKTLLSFLATRLSGQKAALLKLIITSLLLAIPGILLPILSQIFLDDVLIGGNHSKFTYLIMFMIAFVILQAVLSYYRNILLVKLQKKMILVSARDFLDNMLRLPISFFDQRYAGDLTHRVESNANISDFLAGDPAQTLLNIFMAVFYLILLLIYSPLLTLIAVGSVLVNLLIVRLTSASIASKAVKLQQDCGKLAGAVYAGLSITDTLKASGAENEYVNRILRYSAETDRLNQKYNKSQQLINAVPGAIKLLADILILMTGGILIIRGHMTVGMLVAFSTLFGSFHDPINALTGFVKTLQETRADISRVEDILNYGHDKRYDAGRDTVKQFSKLKGDVQFVHVSFGYNILEPPLIQDYNFHVPCGSSIAFVGFSGCGKSTITKLISGLYQPWDGEVLFDGISQNSISAEIISASISTVSQNPALFSGSIRDNLTMWNQSITQEDIIAAATDACIHDVILQKPGNYSYQLSENASNLSGGERERLEIARALVSNPSILIMDEATSALDPITEKKIVDNIKRRGCTCIIIAHRLSAVRDCDQILVMDHGRIVQQGTHETLAETAGLYQDLMKNQ